MVKIGDKIKILGTTPNGYDTYKCEIPESYIGNIAIVVSVDEKEIEVDFDMEDGYCLNYDEYELVDEI